MSARHGRVIDPSSGALPEIFNIHFPPLKIFFFPLESRVLRTEHVVYGTVCKAHRRHLIVMFGFIKI